MSLDAGAWIQIIDLAEVSAGSLASCSTTEIGGTGMTWISVAVTVVGGSGDKNNERSEKSVELKDRIIGGKEWFKRLRTESLLAERNCGQSFKGIILMFSSIRRGKPRKGVVPLG